MERGLNGKLWISLKLALGSFFSKFKALGDYHAPVLAAGVLGHQGMSQAWLHWLSKPFPQVSFF